MEKDEANTLMNDYEYLKVVEDFEKNPQRDINDLEQAIKVVIESLEKSCLTTIKEIDLEKTALMLSGGIDSAFLYHIYKKNNIEIKTICAGTKKSKDLEFVKKHFDHNRIEFMIFDQNENNSKKEFLHIFGNYNDLLNLSLGLPLYLICKKLKNRFKYLILGSGTEELFFGYHYQQRFLEKEMDMNKINKFQIYELKNLPIKDLIRNKKILDFFDMQGILPYLEKGFVMNALRINPKLNSHELRKLVLRKSAIHYGIKEEIALRKKIAFQYGTGIRKML
ncbi:MAG: asparagine synthase C-terminal domain-containing protein [Candidatus Micrarchaeota archaeon]|nr:asparagine synthase C-terminal domain-containing protein [Candidatus Micrarchaeota archaeon]